MSASTPQPHPSNQPDNPVELQLRRMTRRSFTAGAIAAAGGLAGLGWLKTRAPIDGLEWPLRRTLEWNERLAQAYFRSTRRAPSFPMSAARTPRPNGAVGLGNGFDPKTWSLRVATPNDRRLPKIGLDAIKTLPRVEMVTELKCIEGWSERVYWAGARLADFVQKFRLMELSNPFKYATLSTPDDAYYVGLDIESALHAQTLLCYEMNGEPLTSEHGAPLRLVIPLKYGIKNIKRIGTIRFTNERPADYCAERGYDWYAGH